MRKQFPHDKRRVSSLGVEVLEDRCVLSGLGLPLVSGLLSSPLPAAALAPATETAAIPASTTPQAHTSAGGGSMGGLLGLGINISLNVAVLGIQADVTLGSGSAPGSPTTGGDAGQGGSGGLLGLNLGALGLNVGLDVGGSSPATTGSPPSTSPGSGGAGLPGQGLGVQPGLGGTGLTGGGTTPGNGAGAPTAPGGGVTGNNASQSGASFNTLSNSSVSLPQSSAGQVVLPVNNSIELSPAVPTSAVGLQSLPTSAASTGALALLQTTVAAEGQGNALPPAVAIQAEATTALQDLHLTATPRPEDEMWSLAWSQTATVEEPANMIVQEAGSDAVTNGLAPQSAGLQMAAAPGASAALEQALQQLLGQLTEARQTMTGWLRELGPWPWLLMGVTCTALGAELVRRRQQARAELGGLDGEAALEWFPAVAGPGE